MSKKEQLENLATFIGLRAAHEILIRLTNKPESIPHLKQEVDTYNDLIFDLAEGNWNNEDIKKIEESAKKKCNKKLDTYIDIGNEKFSLAEKVIADIMIDLELENA